MIEKTLRASTALGGWPMSQEYERFATYLKVSDRLIEDATKEEIAEVALAGNKAFRTIDAALKR